MNPLQHFNGDVATKEALLAFIIQHINNTALDRMYEGVSVEHIKDAKELIEGAFDKLDSVYGLNKKPVNIINEAK